MTSNWSAFWPSTADNLEALDSCRPSRRPQKHWTWVKTFSLISCVFFVHTDPALCQESMTSLERHQLQIICADISSTPQQQLVVLPLQFPAFYSPKQGHWSRAGDDWGVAMATRCHQLATESAEMFLTSNLNVSHSKRSVKVSKKINRLSWNNQRHFCINREENVGEQAGTSEKFQVFI